jgi:hypothetical protein
MNLALAHLFEHRRKAKADQIQSINLDKMRLTDQNAADARRFTPKLRTSIKNRPYDISPTR